MINDKPSLPSTEQESRGRGAKWDLLLLDIEKRTLEVIHLKKFETWKVIALFLSTTAAWAGVILALAHLLR